MVIETAVMLKHVGEPIPFQFEEQCPEMDFGREPVEIDKPLIFEGESRLRNDVYLVDGELKVHYKAQCARCLKPLEREMDLEVHEEFARYEMEDNPDRYLFQGPEIDLTQMIEDTILLHLPLRHLCDDNCKGLCPICGADRNVVTCSCGAEGDSGEDQPLNPFAALKTLLRDNEEEV